ncbi:MAG: helix-turn-helix domain-containing protein [Patescibacteria group bacterium]|nr:helix-turn-helix domain-containing protein [Patescibacteria group bacterium]
MKTAIETAISIAGSQSELARRCHVGQPTVWKWLNRAKRVPAEFVLPIERATGGKVSRHDLRPDIYPHEKSA